MREKENRILSLDAVRVLAVLAVVMIHISADFVKQYPKDTYEFAVGNILNSMSYFAVPVFIMVSGALLLDEDKSISTSKLCSHYIGRLISLIVIWSFFYALIDRVVLPFLRGETVDVVAAVYSLMMGHYHMWYLYLLLGLYLSLPILRCFVNVKNKTIVLGYIVISLLTQFTEPVLTVLSSYSPLFLSVEELLDKFYFQFFSGYIAYFLTGWYIVRVGLQNKYHRTILILIGFCSLVVTVLYIWFTGDYINGNSRLNIFTYLYSVGAFSLFTGRMCGKVYKYLNMVAKLSSLSFGVYIIHPVFKKAIQMFFGYRGNPLLYIVINFVFVSVVSFAISYLMSRSKKLKRLIRL